MRRIGQMFRFLIPVIALVALVVFLVGAGRRERARLEKNKAIVRASVEKFWNTGDLAVADEFYATNWVEHHPGVLGEVRGLEGLKKWAKAEFVGFPDMRVTIEDLVAEGDKVVKRWRTRETHTGEYYGVPPTGKEVTNMGTTIYRIADGKLAEGWWSYDSLGKWEQLGFKLAPAKK